MESTKFKYLAKAQTFYDSCIWSKYGPPQGVTPDDVTALELKMGVKFPLAFVEYLLWMGVDSPVYAGSDAFYEHIFDNGTVLDEIFEDNDIDYKHPSKPIVSLTHQGYIASWFYVEQGLENPICYGFSESEDTYPSCKNKKFSDLVYENMIEFAKTL